jgi:hypothetical protein
MRPMSKRLPNPTDDVTRAKMQAAVRSPVLGGRLGRVDVSVTNPGRQQTGAKPAFLNTEEFKLGQQILDGQRDAVQPPPSVDPALREKQPANDTIAEPSSRSVDVARPVESARREAAPKTKPAKRGWLWLAGLAVVAPVLMYAVLREAVTGPNANASSSAPSLVSATSTSAPTGTLPVTASATATAAQPVVSQTATVDPTTTTTTTARTSAKPSTAKPTSKTSETAATATSVPTPFTPKTSSAAPTSSAWFRP